jgi:photosystem II stability/assembly factor-like uncharacterized protein
MCVGTFGTILHTTDGGVSWLAQAAVPGYEYASFRSVHMVDRQTATIVGDAGKILRSTDGGKTWTAQTSGTSYALIDVGFADGMHGIVVGGGQTYPNPPFGFALRTTNGGDGWIYQSLGTGALKGVSIVDATRALATGENGRIARTTDGGIVWTPQSSGTSSTLNDISMSDNLLGTAVGDGGLILRTTDGGTTWTRQISGVTNQLTGVSFANARTGTVVGAYWATILHTTNGGATWALQDPGTQSALTAVVQVDETTATAVGAWGTILGTRSGGLVSVHERPTTTRGDPPSFVLCQNYPNPCNAVTTFEFRVAGSGVVTLRVHDVLGNEVATLVNEVKAPGVYTVWFDAGNHASGVYFYRLQAGHYTATRKLLLVQ